MNKKRIYVAVLIICVLVIIPISVALITSTYIVKIETNNDWIGYWGSYVGGIIGGIGTLFAVYVTTSQTRKEIELRDLKEIQDEKIREYEKNVQFISEYIAGAKRYIHFVKQINGDCKIVSDELNQLEEELKMYERWREMYSQHNVDGYKREIDEKFEKSIYLSEFETQFELCKNDEKKLCIVKREYQNTLVNRIRENKDMIIYYQEKLDEEKRKFVIGNPTYELLKIKLVKDGYEKIEKMLNECYFIIGEADYSQSSFWISDLKEKTFINKIEKLYEELRDFQCNL